MSILCLAKGDTYMTISNENKNLYTGPDGLLFLFEPVENVEPETTMMKINCFAPNGSMSPEFVYKYLDKALNNPERGDICITAYAGSLNVFYDEAHHFTALSTAFIIMVHNETTHKISFYTNILSIEDFGRHIIYLYETLSNHLKNKLNDANKPTMACANVTADALVENDSLFYLFSEKLLGVYCDSEAEYKDLIQLMIQCGISVAKSVNPEGWNDVTKWIMFDYEMNTVYATYRVPETVDKIVPYTSMKKNVLETIQYLSEVASEDEEY